MGCKNKARPSDLEFCGYTKEILRAAKKHRYVGCGNNEASGSTASSFSTDLRDEVLPSISHSFSQGETDAGNQRGSDSPNSLLET